MLIFLVMFVYTWRWRSAENIGGGARKQLKAAESLTKRAPKTGQEGTIRGLCAVPRSRLWDPSPRGQSQRAPMCPRGRISSEVCRVSHLQHAMLRSSRFLRPPSCPFALVRRVHAPAPPDELCARWKRTSELHRGPQALKILTLPVRVSIRCQTSRSLPAIIRPPPALPSTAVSFLLHPWPSSDRVGIPYRPLYPFPASPVRL